jgi:hypothetical protein
VILYDSKWPFGEFKSRITDIHNETILLEKRKQSSMRIIERFELLIGRVLKLIKSYPIF